MCLEFKKYPPKEGDQLDLPHSVLVDPLDFRDVMWANVSHDQSAPLLAEPGTSAWVSRMH